MVDDSTTDDCEEEQGIVNMAKSAGAPTEDASCRDGPFSYKSEPHAFGNGLFVGFTSNPLQRPPVPETGTLAREDYEAERHYWRIGYVVGTLAQVAIIVTFAVLFGPEVVSGVLGMA